MPCPTGADPCGGDWAIHILYTGVRLVRPQLPPVPQESVRIVFMMTVFGEQNIEEKHKIVYSKHKIVYSKSFKQNPLDISKCRYTYFIFVVAND